MPDIIAKDVVVIYNYTLKTDSEEIVGKEEGLQTPYLHGFDNIFPKVEEEMEGKKVGDRLSITLAPKDGFGEKNPTTPQEVPRDAFPEDADMEEGAMFHLETPDGEVLPFWLAKVEKNSVFLDSNHPLAGQTIHFEIEITGLRDAKPDELAHGHPHGVDGESGHHH